MAFYSWINDMKIPQRFHGLFFYQREQTENELTLYICVERVGVL